MQDLNTWFRQTQQDFLPCAEPVTFAVGFVVMAVLGMTVSFPVLITPVVLVVVVAGVLVVVVVRDIAVVGGTVVVTGDGRIQFPS